MDLPIFLQVIHDFNNEIYDILAGILVRDHDDDDNVLIVGPMALTWKILTVDIG